MTIPYLFLFGCFVWACFLIGCAVLMGPIQFVSTRFIPARWKIPIQLTPEQKKARDRQEAYIGFTVVALLLLAGLLQKF